ncbi:hypothetical protein GGR52DRAFT_137066 [Hypoxylon sp. FL1284]|nr:hypothetical protein GGR52DRAFT_137066 [Hypoxylon sp. FL1284]
MHSESSACKPEVTRDRLIADLSADLSSPRIRFCDPWDINLVDYASSLRDHLRFARQFEPTFGFTVEMIGGRLSIVNNQYGEIISVVSRFASFLLGAFTSYDADLEDTVYVFDSLRCLVLFRYVAYIPDSDDHLDAAASEPSPTELWEQAEVPLELLPAYWRDRRADRSRLESDEVGLADEERDDNDECPSLTYSSDSESSDDDDGGDDMAWKQGTYSLAD